MTAENVFTETYDLLTNIGVVSTRKEFNRDWLGVSEGYFRCLRFNNKQPSTQTLATCSSKLKHYSLLFAQRSDTESKVIANKFSSLATRLDSIIHAKSKSKWVSITERVEAETMC